MKNENLPRRRIPAWPAGFVLLGSVLVPLPLVALLGDMFMHRDPSYSCAVRNVDAGKLGIDPESGHVEGTWSWWPPSGLTCHYRGLDGGVVTVVTDPHLSVWSIAIAVGLASFGTALLAMFVHHLPPRKPQLSSET